jgi:transcriptional regulator with XRE-family HTH domain
MRSSDEVTFLEQLRVDRGLNIQDVALRSGVAHKTISRWESAYTPRPGTEALHKLARFYRVEPSTVLAHMRRDYTLRLEREAAAIETDLLRATGNDVAAA